VDVLVGRTIQAAAERGTRSVIVSGGVACNSLLRSAMRAACETHGLALAIPAPKYCTDNAAMIAAAGRLHLERGERAELDLTAQPGWKLGGAEAARHSLRHK
jgi:N6-L-threonylcarbamoyladenine synthase